MQYLTIEDIIIIHKKIINIFGGMEGLRDKAALESSVNQPFITMAGEELYPSLFDKASAFAFFIVSNHPFVDGNKRVGHAAMESLLILNGYEINCPLEEQEKAIIKLAEGRFEREGFRDWVKSIVKQR